MIMFDPLQFIAVAYVACGLLAVILEIALMDPRDLWDMIDDARSFAERPKTAQAVEHPNNAPRLSA